MIRSEFVGFRRIRLAEWQQFRGIDIEFHPRLTVLTGANGSGKSTILRFLGRHFGWTWTNLRTPHTDRKTGLLTYVTRFFRRSESLLPTPGSFVEVGEIEYTSGRKSTIRIPLDDSAAYYPTIDVPHPVAGVFLPSHRPEFTYSHVESIPLRPRFGHDAFTLVQNALQSAGQAHSARSSTYHMKEILISLAIFGFGNAAVEANPEAMRLYEGFQNVLREVLPPELGFEQLAVRGSSEVVFVTKYGEFLLDAVSGGVGALLVLAWQLFMFANTTDSGYTVVIDEPENHLHPKMQRTLLPDLLRAFPKVTFVVATHSPLIVGSVRESNIYALSFEYGGVKSVQLDLERRAASATEILQDVLGVPVTLPVWAESEIASISDRYSHMRMTEDTLTSLRSELTRLGLERWVPDVIVNWHKAQAPR